MNLVNYETKIKGDSTPYNPDDINFSEAINTVDEESCFKLSGSKLILDYLRQRLGENTSMIIDFSAMPTIYQTNGVLPDFITVYDPKSAFTPNLDNAYNHVYKTILKGEGIGLFYKSDFFRFPQSPAFYYSTYEYDNNKDEEYNRIKNQQFISKYDKPDKYDTQNNRKWDSIHQYGRTDIKFKNMSFPLNEKEFEELIRKNPSITSEMRNDILFQFYNKYFLNENTRQQDEKRAHLLSIPLIGYPGNEDNYYSRYEGLGAIFIYFITDSVNDFFLEKIANDLWFLGLQTTYNPVFQIAHQLFKTARKEATKAAKAAIMSRNMSHNLGSHVMSYLKMHLGSVSNILRDHVLSTLLESEDLDTLRNHALVADELTLPFLVGIGRFISYLQERQDFIATVSTDFVPFHSSVNFKDFIFDELNCDKRYERHPKRTNFKPDNILLGNIARSEGLGRQTSPTKTKTETKEDRETLSDIVLKFRTTFDGSPVVRIEYEDQSGTKRVVNPKVYYNDKVDIAKDELYQMRQYELSLPGGIVGRQAIFSIIENVIRNAAKHGNCKGKLELTLDIFTKEDVDNKQPDEELKRRLRNDDQADDQSLSLKDVLKTFYCENRTYSENDESDNYNEQYKYPSINDATISKRRSRFREAWEPKDYTESVESADDYYFITLTDNLDLSSEALASIRRALIDDYIDENGEMSHTNKGIKEMRISAAWLRSIDNDTRLSPFDVSNCEIEGEKLWRNNDWKNIPPVLYARRSKDATNGNICHLQYIFCVMRPKKVAYVSPKLGEETIFNVSLGNGWFFMSPDKYLDSKNKNYDFIIFNDEIDKGGIVQSDEDESAYKIVRRYSSNRFFKLSELTEDDNVILKDIENGVTHINRTKEDEINKDDIESRTEDVKRKTEDLYLRLYQHLSVWDGKEKILIDDDRVKSHHEALLNPKNNKEESASNHQDEEKSTNEKLLTSEKLTFSLYLKSNDGQEKDKNIKYRYIKHLEEKGEFEKKAINYDKHFDFSEGITGDNSTDRLVRNEVKTELWFSKQLHAMKQKIAIFDERIFAKVTGVDESDFIDPGYSWGEQLDKDKQSLIEKNRHRLNKQDIKQIEHGCRNHNHLDKLIKSIHLERPEDSNVTSMSNVNAKNHLGATYKYKNLHIFTIIRSEEDPEGFNLYGIEIDKGNNVAFSQCVKYATLKWDSSNKRLIIENDAKQKTDWMQFHSLSIHQGLLDKLYAVFGIQKNDIESKENLTKDFYEHFIIDANDKRIKFRDSNNILRYFLPGMTIHSGRSKPSKEDMPQQLPFIPYSALEHAVLDCKFSIVELLDSARYE